MSQVAEAHASPTSVRRAERGTPEEESTVDRLVTAAADVFAERGYDGAGVAEIARRAGLTTGAIYSRFSGKAELLAEAIRACTADELDELFAETDGARAAGSGGTARAAGSGGTARAAGSGGTARAAGSGGTGAAEVLATVGTHLVTRPPEPGRALLLEAFVAARRDPEVAAVLRDHLSGRAARMSALVEASKAAGDVDPDVDTDAVVHFAHAVGLGFLLYEAIGAANPAPEPWHDVITRVLSSIVPDPARPPTTPTTPERSPTDGQ
jgi:AcrR family transcriptional regulator